MTKDLSSFSHMLGLPFTHTKAISPKRVQIDKRSLLHLFRVKLRFGYHSFPLTAFAQMGGMFASLRSAQPSVLGSSRTQNHQDMTALA